MRKTLLAFAALAALSAPAAAQNLPATTFNVVGSIGNLSMYTAREVPFWNEQLPAASGGAIRAQVKPFTELGFRGPEIFRLVSNGTLQFATTVLNYNSGEVPMNEAADLVGLVGSVEELQRVVNVFRPQFSAFLEQRYGMKLLGFGSYQAQVIYCRDAFTQVADLRGRKVRASCSISAARPSPWRSPRSSPHSPTAWSIARSPAPCRATGRAGTRRRASSPPCRSISAWRRNSPICAGGTRSTRACAR